MNDSGSAWTLQWLAGQEPVDVEDEPKLAELLRLAESDAAGQPLMVELRSPSGASLTFGLGRELSVATFAASASTPPYFVSKGDGGQASTLVFFRDGHWSEFDGDAAISAAAAREAAISFLSTGERPANVQWSDV